MLNMASLPRLQVGKLKMDDKVIRYTVTFSGVAVVGFLLFLVYQVMQRIVVDASLLAQLIGMLQALLAVGAGYFTRHKLSGNKKDQTP